MGRNAVYRFRPEHVFTIYDSIRVGHTREETAAKLGIPLHVFKQWIKHKLPAKYAYKMGKIKQEEKMKSTNGEALDDYILGKLPENLRPMWDMLRYAQQTKTPIPTEVQCLEVEQRQMLFLTAWFRYKFSTYKALRMTGIKRDTFLNWMTIPKFQKMMKELQEAKKDFFEDALIGCVERGETPAIVFVNKTMNKDRGYGDSKEVKISGQIGHEHNHVVNISLEDLDLPLEVMAVIAEAMEKRKKFLESLQDDQGRRPLEIRSESSQDEQGQRPFVPLIAESGRVVVVESSGVR